MSATMTIQATEFRSPADAVQCMCDEEWGMAIQVGSRYLVAERAEVHRLEAAGLPFAYLHDVRGALVTVPVN